MSTLSPELTHNIDVIAARRADGLVGKFLARRALKKEVRAIEPLIGDNPSFAKLEALSGHVSPDDSEIVALVVRPELDDTVELLLEGIPEEGLPRKASLGIQAVWAALHAWESMPSDKTTLLAERTLDNFHGGAQYQLQTAFSKAKETGRTIQDELSDLNDKRAA